MNKNECCNHDCNQGRDCPERRVTVRRSARERTMTHPIPGADSERAAFDEAYRSYSSSPDWKSDDTACAFHWDRLAGYIWRKARAAAKVGANVAADSIDTEEFQRLATEWASSAEISDPDWNPEATLRLWNRLIAHIDARIAAGAPAETPKPTYESIDNQQFRNLLSRSRRTMTERAQQGNRDELVRLIDDHCRRQIAAQPSPAPTILPTTESEK